LCNCKVFRQCELENVSSYLYDFAKLFCNMGIHRVVRRENLEVHRFWYLKSRHPRSPGRISNLIILQEIAGCDFQLFNGVRHVIKKEFGAIWSTLNNSMQLLTFRNVPFSDIISLSKSMIFLVQYYQSALRWKADSMTLSKYLSI